MLSIQHLLEDPYGFIMSGYVQRFISLCEHPPSKCPAKSDLLHSGHLSCVALGCPFL